MDSLRLLLFFLCFDGFFSDAFMVPPGIANNRIYEQVPNKKIFDRSTAPFAKRKGDLKKQLEATDEKSLKKSIKERGKEIKNRIPGSPLGMNPEKNEKNEKIEAPKNEKVVQVVDDSEEEDSDMTPSMKEGSNLIQYSKVNGLAVDLETMATVQMPKKKDEKIKNFLPEPTQEMIERNQFPLQPTVQQFLDTIESMVPSEGSDLSKLKEFLLVNRHVGGHRGIRTLLHLQLKAQSEGNKEKALRLRHLSASVMKAESSITGVFRQVMKNAENRIAPMMGSLDVSSFAGADTADVTATFLCLKAVVAEWEKKYVESTDKNIISLIEYLEIEEAVKSEESTYHIGKVCSAVQEMSKALAKNTVLFSMLLPEAVLIEKTISVTTRSEVRRVALQEICPTFNLSPEQLRRRMLNLLVSMDLLSQNSYMRLRKAVQELYDCLVEGTAEAYDIYTSNIGPGKELSFDTYNPADADPQPWRQVLHQIITTKKIDLENEQDYSVVLKSLLPDLSSLIPKSKAPIVNWVQMLDENVGKDLLAELRKKDTEMDDQFGEDIYDDFERRYGLDTEE